MDKDEKKKLAKLYKAKVKMEARVRGMREEEALNLLTILLKMQAPPMLLVVSPTEVEFVKEKNWQMPESRGFYMHTGRDSLMALKRMGIENVIQVGIAILNRDDVGIDLLEVMLNGNNGKEDIVGFSCKKKLTFRHRVAQKGAASAELQHLH